MQSLVADLPSSNKPADGETSTTPPEHVVFGLPAVTNPAGTLKERHILWTPVVSAGEKLPLPLDSCCSVSLVSRSHADLVASKCPHLKFQSLEKPVAVSVADDKSQLIGTCRHHGDPHTMEQWQGNHISDARSSWSFLAHSIWRKPFTFYTSPG